MLSDFYENWLQKTWIKTLPSSSFAEQSCEHEANFLQMVGELVMGRAAQKTGQPWKLLVLIWTFPIHSSFDPLPNRVFFRIVNRLISLISAESSTQPGVHLFIHSNIFVEFPHNARYGTWNFMYIILLIYLNKPMSVCHHHQFT